ncbi:MAG: hypothetical protein QOH39_2088 [Verrucomicrobiota bacterium]|jgi:hypothetical protein
MTTRRSVLLLLPALAIACHNCNAAHDTAFWKSIVENKFAIPANEPPGRLALEIADLAASTDPTLRDKYGYEILAAWIYKDHKLGPGELEPLRKKLLPGMVFHIGESGTDTIFRRSFSALYMSVLAAEDLNRPFLSASAFQETFDAALRCYAEEKDLRGYVPGKGWAHATAHVADLLKFLARNEKILPDMQKRIVASVAQRSRTAGIVFTWGEDARMAATLLSVANRNDFNTSGFNEWFSTLVAEHKALWQGEAIDSKAYASVRAQTNVLAHFAAKIAAQKDISVPSDFRTSLNAVILQVD